MRITDEELKIINELKKKQDHHAFCLGVARVEYLKQENFWMNKISDTEDEQERVGQEILKLHGIDPELGDFTISDDGEIITLKAGEYISMNKH